MPCCPPKRFLPTVAMIAIDSGTLVPKEAASPAFPPPKAGKIPLPYDKALYKQRHKPFQRSFNPPHRCSELHDTPSNLPPSYLLKTNRKDLSGDELWRTYILLTRAENAFREMKSPLAERPIFHHLEHRVDCHIFLCVLAYHLLISIEKTLLDHGIHTFWPTVRDALKTHQVCTIVLPTKSGACLRIRRDATRDAEVQVLYDRLGVPAQATKPQHTWTEPANSD
jgi:hypothetical protein